MTQNEYKRWQEHNLQVLKLGGTLSISYMVDGTIEEYREIGDQRVRNDPNFRNELVAA